ncbi:unnamed protein product [Durusdinium trenchii]|uniref:C3H1-type domain-containing protein n=1 Tax=Durusdinium trenchii TaxID=1381693 RepID=A0ABP0SA16_9DINO
MDRLLSALQSYDAAVFARPFTTNMATCGFINVVSELLRQRLQGASDPTGVPRQALLGSCLVAPLSTTWFMILERLFRSWDASSLATVVSKTCCEQAFFAPVINTCFMTFQGLLEGRGIQEIKDELQRNFWTVQRGNFAVWAPANLISYKFIPPRLRVLFANTVAVFWMLFLIWKTSKRRPDPAHSARSAQRAVHRPRHLDEDHRFDPLKDDPRERPGAQLGRAQKAAIGADLGGSSGSSGSSLAGRNTASFDPRSTLVRPAMRVIYGRNGREFGVTTRPDDIVVVPEFMGDLDDSLASCLIAELKTSDAEDPKSIPSIRTLTARMCEYFQVDQRTVQVRVRWHETGTSPASQLQSASFGPSNSRKACLLHLSLGGTAEHAFKRVGTGEVVYFPQGNNTLMLLGCDIVKKWSSGESKAPEDLNVLVSLWGSSKKALEDRLPEKAKEVCRDFHLGRCTYGDKCKFPHEKPSSHEELVAWPARPSMRVITVHASQRYTAPVKHDDVIIVPEFFCGEDDWNIYYTLIKEMRQSQANGDWKAEWVSWHEGAHLLSQNPSASDTYNEVIDSLCQYFSATDPNRGTRFNWYRDGSDWKPFHHDSAAFNEQRAANQNCTIGISFGSTRELAFRHAKTGELIYVPQKNGMLFYFGRDVNIIWQHGINALPEQEQDGKGRISIILWSLCELCIEESDSPPMLTDESRGSYSMHNKGKGKGKGKRFCSNGDGLCRDFQRGFCSYGEKCRFLHR